MNKIKINWIASFMFHSPLMLLVIYMLTSVKRTSPRHHKSLYLFCWLDVQLRRVFKWKVWRHHMRPFGCTVLDTVQWTRNDTNKAKELSFKYHLRCVFQLAITLCVFHIIQVFHFKNSVKKKHQREIRFEK